MKKQIFILIGGFSAALLIMIIYVAFSSNKIDDEIEMKIDFVNEPRPILIELGDSAIFQFTEEEYDDLLSIIKKADINAMRCQMYVDTTETVNLGIINHYQFSYKWMYYTNHHFFTMRDTISGREYNTLRFSTTFTDNLILF